MRMKKMEKDFVSERKIYSFYLLSSLINAFIFSFGYILSLTFFKETDPHIFLFLSSFILALTLYFNSINKFEGFYEYSVSGILVLNGDYRFSLYFFRLLGIFLSGIIGTLVFSLIFYWTNLWTTGISPEVIALKISNLAIKTSSYSYGKLILSSLSFGAFAGFVYYYRYHFDEHSNTITLFFVLFLFSILMFGSYFINYMIEMINYVLVLLMKGKLIEAGLRKAEAFTFSGLMMRLFIIWVFNFFGILLISIPALFGFERLKGMKVD